MRCAPLSRSLRVLGAGAGGRRVIDDAEPAAGLQRLVQSFSTSGTSCDSQKKSCSTMNATAPSSEFGCEPELVERLVETHDVRQAVVREPLVDRLAAGALVEPRRVLHVDLAVRPDGAREHLGRVAAGGEQLDDGHARPHAEELHDLRVVPVVVARAILGQPLLAVDRGLDRRMNRRRLRGLRLTTAAPAARTTSERRF